ncbi:hypothetical protein [Thiobacillus denitrificans]|nr:hypothetical protein [Thiobacillus denitrificans]
MSAGKRSFFGDLLTSMLDGIFRMAEHETFVAIRLNFSDVPISPGDLV